MNWAVVRNVGTGGLMIREKLKRQTRKSESTEADHRGGIACSSEREPANAGKSEEAISSGFRNGQPKLGGAVE